MGFIRGSTRAAVILRAVLALALIVGLIFAYYLAPLHVFDFNHPVRQWIGVVALVALLAALITAQIRLVLRGPMDVAIIGLPVVVCMSIVGFSAVYVVFGREPGEFVGLATRTDALYFTVSTLATVGFGDVHASGQGAEVAVILQIVFNLVFVAGAISVFTARLRGRLRSKFEGAPPDGR